MNLGDTPRPPAEGRCPSAFPVLDSAADCVMLSAAKHLAPLVDKPSDWELIMPMFVRLEIDPERK